MSGPRWFLHAYVGAAQLDGKGEIWSVVRVEQGGRVLHWESMQDQRKARTECTKGHPEYPSDETVLEAKRTADRKAKAARRSPYGYYP